MSEQPYLYRLRLSVTEWIAAIERAHQSRPFTYIYAEEAAGIHLTDYRPPLPEWRHGRAFGPEREIRWSIRRDGQVDLVLLTEKPFANQDNWQPCELLAKPFTEDKPAAETTGTELAAESEEIMLLGVSRRHPKSPYPSSPTAPKAWTDSRIPRPLLYPLAEAQSRERWVKLKVKTYRVNGCLLLTRMVDLEGTSYVKPI